MKLDWVSLDERREHRAVLPDGREVRVAYNDTRQLTFGEVIGIRGPESITVQVHSSWAVPWSLEVALVKEMMERILEAARKYGEDT